MSGKLIGVTFQKVKAEYDAKGRRNLVPSGEPDQTIPCDDVLVAVGQENAFPWIERDCGIEFDKWNMPQVDAKTFVSTNPKVFFGGDAAFGPKNIIWAVAHGHDAAISIEVCDCGRFIRRRVATERSEGGRGIPIMSAVTDDFELVPETGGTRVRFGKRLVAAAA